MVMIGVAIFQILMFFLSCVFRSKCMLYCHVNDQGITIIFLKIIDQNLSSTIEISKATIISFLEIIVGQYGLFVRLTSLRQEFQSIKRYWQL